MTIVYTVLNSGFSFILSLFYRRIDVRGQENIPEKGPVVFCGNHGNGLVDPVIIMAVADRQVCTIAKSTLFSMPLLGQVLRGLKAVPVRRRQDFQGTTQDNSPALDAMAQILERGDCLAIFPEGISHDAPEIHELKTGFARAAMQAIREKNSDDFEVTIIPVGLNFMAKDRFRSDVFVEFAKPTILSKQSVYGDAPVEKYEEISRKYAHELANAVKLQLEQVTLVAPSWDVLRVLHLARDLYSDRGDDIDADEYIELTHRFVNGYQRAKGEEEVKEIFSEISTYQSQLDLLRITDKMVAEFSLSKAQIALHFFKTLFFYLFTLPVSLPGSIVHGPLGIIVHYLALYMSRAEKGVDRDQVAHYKVLSSVVLLPIWYTMFGVIIWRYIGAPFIPPILVCTFLSGYLAVQNRPLNFTFKALGFVMKFLFTDFSALRATRRRLQTKLREIINKYREKYDVRN
eukprot:Phypoly_transcript_07877.p1 GENE.Phypoly_transcript_07877~~Phypoly_transcript_07877.p1  ORF type:complete len:458 (+),score=75.43 Phypoly_transcript_07877:182-1555(+)